jgi:hypothetical protein
VLAVLSPFRERISVSNVPDVPDVPDVPEPRCSGLAQTPAVRWRRPGGAILSARRHHEVTYHTALRTDIERQFTHLESEALIRPQRGR